MRKLFALSLIAYLLAITSPFLALADETEGSGAEDEAEAETTDAESTTDETSAGTPEELANAIDAPIMCPFGGGAVPYGTYTTEEKREYYDSIYESIDTQYEIEFNSNADSNNCGEPNNYSGFLEKGDCSADGLVVTEITEVLAPDVTLDENTKIITVYAGLCCLAGEVTEDRDGDGHNDVVTCDDVRTIYTTDDESGTGGYDKCTTSAVNCEKRQWVIGGSGIGIVKLMVKQIFTFGALAVGSIAVGTIVFQGIKISVSGVSGDISESKNKILQAIAGIVLLFLSGLLLYTINPEFFGS